MISPNDQFAAFREWDSLSRRREFRGPFDRPLILPGTDIFSVYRDEDYNLRGDFGCTVERDLSPQQTQRPWPQDCDVVVNTTEGQVVLQRCALLTTAKSPKAQSGPLLDDISGSFTLEEVRFKSAGKIDETLSHQEWYLNGASAPGLFNRVTNRRMDVRYRTTRGEQDDVFEVAEWNRSATDHIIVKLASHRCTIAEVHPEFPPDWSRKIVIEYRPEWGGIPVAADRDGMRECLGFVLGRPLVKVGETTLTPQGFLAGYSAQSHGVQNIRHVCKHGGNSPFRLQPLTHQTTESILQRLLPKYMEKRGALPLSIVLSRCWASQTLPPGLNILVLATALECLADAWFRLPTSASRGTYLPQKEFNALVHPEIASLQMKLSGHAGGSTIAKRILGINQLGANDRMEMFLQEIGLQYGKCEKHLLRSRNKYAHGYAAKTAAEGQRALVAWFLYLSLFNRVILKILGWEGSYTDHSGNGSPDHPVGEAMIGDVVV